MLESHKVFWNKHGRIKPVKWQYKIKNINKIKHHSTSNLSKKVLVLPKENWNSVEKGKKKIQKALRKERKLDCEPAWYKTPNDGEVLVSG